MLTLKKISDEKVNGIVHSTKCIPVYNSLLGNYLCHRIVILGHSQSGKSNLARHIIDKANTKDTQLFIISPTAEKEKLFDDLKEDDEKNQFISSLNDSQITQILDLYKDEQTIIKKKGQLIEIPKSIILIDDNPEELQKNKSISKLFKTIRHIHSLLIVCCHDPIDLMKTCRQETTLAIIFPGISEERFKLLLTDMGFHNNNYNIDDLFKIYRSILTKKNDFIIFNKTNGEIKKNLNYQIN